VALDAVWYNGHATTADLVAARVPVVSVPGATAAARGAASVLLALGGAGAGARGGGALTAGLARDAHDFEALAAALAARRGALARLRAALPPGPPGVTDSGAWAARLLAGLRAALDLRAAGEALGGGGTWRSAGGPEAGPGGRAGGFAAVLAAPSR